MVIDNLQRIRAIERALRDVIIPAIDPKMANAIEQAGYALGHLSRLAEHGNWEYPFELAEMRDFLALTEALSCIAGDAAPTATGDAARAAIDDAQALAALRVPALAVVKDRVRRLREASDALLKAALDGPPSMRDAAAREVFRTATRREAMDGAWNSGAGYDTTGGNLAALLES